MTFTPDLPNITRCFEEFSSDEEEFAYLEAELAELERGDPEPTDEIWEDYLINQTTLNSVVPMEVEDYYF